jgi:hypothetical protein
MKPPVGSMNEPKRSSAAPRTRRFITSLRARPSRRRSLCPHPPRRGSILNRRQRVNSQPAPEGQFSTGLDSRTRTGDLLRERTGRGRWLRAERRQIRCLRAILFGLMVAEEDLAAPCASKALPQKRAKNDERYRRRFLRHARGATACFEARESVISAHASVGDSASRKA